jgi:GT2 family glycosyltransferase
MLPDLTISLISSDNLDQLHPCLESVFANSQSINLEVFLVDNASTDGTADTVQRAFPEVNVIQNDTRLGFSSNNNQVLSQGRGRYLMLLNDDTLVTDGALDKLVSFMDEHPEAAAIGAFLLNGDGSPQSSYANFPRPIMEAIWPATNRSHFLVGKRTEPFEVDSVCGAAMLVRREILADVGSLDTDFDPIYSEEVEWCYRIKAGGGKIFMHPEARIIHYGSQTMDRVVPQKYELLLAHKHLFFKKHYGARSAATYKIILMAVTVFKFLWWSLVELVRPSKVSDHSRSALHKDLISRISHFS